MKKITLVNLHGKLGMFHYSYHFANALAQMDCGEKVRVQVLLPSYSDPSPFLPHITLFRLQASHSALHFLWETFIPRNWICIWNTFRKSDTIHFLDNHPWMLLMIPLARLLRKEVVTTIHDLAPHPGESNAFFRMIQRAIIRLSFIFSVRVVIHSEIYKESIAKNYQKKLVIVPHGIFNQLPDLTKEVTRDRNSVLFFGRIREYKGLDVLIEAWEKVTYPNKRLVIAGEGKINRTLKEKIEKNSSIKLYNRHIEDQEVAEFFYGSSLLVLPYKEATQSGPLLLAYNYKMPVLATDAGSLSEYVEEAKTGYIIPASNVSALVHSLERFYSLPTSGVEEMGINAFTKAQKEFSWDSIVKRIYCKL